MCAFICRYVHQNAGDCEGQKKMADSLRADISSSLTWVFQTKGVSSARTLCTVNQWSISPALKIKFLADTSSACFVSLWSFIWQRITFSVLANVEQFWIVYWTPWCCSTEALAHQMLLRISLSCYHRRFCCIQAALSLLGFRWDFFQSVLKIRNLPMKRLWTDNRSKLSTEFCKAASCQAP